MTWPFEDTPINGLAEKLTEVWKRRDREGVRKRYTDRYDDPIAAWFDDTMLELAHTAIDYCAPVKAHAIDEDELDAMVQADSFANEMARQADHEASVEKRSRKWVEDHPFRNLWSWLLRRIG